MICLKCDKKAELVTGEHIHPFNEKYKKYNSYICTACGDYVGCHEGTTKALGTLADKRLREKRIQVHKAFDQIWKNLSMSIKQAYIHLAEMLDIPLVKCHIGLFDLDLCQRVLEVVIWIKRNTKDLNLSYVNNVNII